MTDKEAFKLVSMIKAAFPHSFRQQHDDDFEIMCNVFQFAFDDDNAEHVMKAFKVYLKTGGDFSPTPSALSKLMTKGLNPELTETAGQAWEQVYSNLGSYGRERESEGTAELSPIAKQVVRSMGWRYLCNSQNIEWDRKDFVKAYAEMQDVMSSKVAQGQDLNHAIEGKTTKRLEGLVKMIGNKND